MSDLSIKTIIKQICAEKGLSEEAVLETINSALAAAFRKDFADKTQNIQAEFELDTGKTTVFDVKEVVDDLSPEELEVLETIKKEREAIRLAIEKGEITPEELKRKREEDRAKAEAESLNAENEEDEEARRFNPKMQIQVSDAKKINKKYKVGDFVKTPLEIPGAFGRMAAQTAKQVIIQRLREAERNVIYQDYKEKEGEILNGLVQKFEGPNIIIDLDNKTSAILPPQEQIRSERFRIGERTKVYLQSVTLTTRGPELIVSRAHADIVKKLFSLEIPEIANGTIEIKGIAREAGNRTKIAVSTNDENLDPIGSCIGQRGARIQTIIHELGGEKIDIIEYSENPIKFISNAILPAKATSVTLNEKEKTAIIAVPGDQLSLTIGRAGQNVRLASKLTGWKLDIQEQETGETVSAVALPDKTDETAKTILAETPSSPTPAEAIETPRTATPIEETKAADKPKKKATKKTKTKK